MMYLSTSIAVSLLLVAPVLSVPMRFSKGNDLQVRNDDLEVRDPGFGNWFNDVKKFAVPVAKVAGSLILRDDANESELSARDVEDLEYLAARDPSFGSWFRKVKKFANVNNLKKAASVASLVIREDSGVDSFAIRDDTNEAELSARDMEDLEYLAARDPSFGSWFRKVKKFANFKNLKKAADVASMVVREDGEVFDGVERDVLDGMELDDLD